VSGFSDCVASEILAEMGRQSMRPGELARRLGWSRPTLARRLASQASFTLADVDRIADLLEIPVDRLIHPAVALCEYCGRQIWRDRLEPCCDRPEHAGRLVCLDAHSCMGVILLRLHDQQHRALGAEQIAAGSRPAHGEVLGQALADAIAYRDPTGICPDCDTHPAGLCEAHAGDLDKTDAYIELGRQLGIELDRG
jgi:transcriptional regulator with XRE-family HTH domain